MNLIVYDAEMTAQRKQIAESTAICDKLAVEMLRRWHYVVGLESILSEMVEEDEEKGVERTMCDALEASFGDGITESTFEEFLSEYLTANGEPVNDEVMNKLKAEINAKWDYVGFFCWLVMLKENAEYHKAA